MVVQALPEKSVPVQVISGYANQELSSRFPYNAPLGCRIVTNNEHDNPSHRVAIPAAPVRGAVETPTGFGTDAARFRVPEKADDHVRLAIATGF